MNFSNYAAFRTAVQRLIEGDDISQSDLSVSTLDLLISMGENRIYRDVRSSTQDTALSLSVTANVATLPSDFLELRGAPYVGTFVPAIYAPWEALQSAIQIGAEMASHPVYYSFEGDTLIFYPQQNGVTVTGRYYKRFTDISGGLNAFFNRHEDLFLYASLAEAGPFLGETTRTEGWEGKYQLLARAANEQERRRITRGSKLQTRVA